MIFIWHKQQSLSEEAKLCMICFVSNLVAFCFKECWVDGFICNTIKQPMIKTPNQEFITLIEPMIYFFLIDSKFLFILSLLAKHR